MNDFHKKHVHIRIHSLPICPQLVRSEFPSCKETGGFICLTGTAVRVSNAKLLEYSKDYQCNRCKAIVQVTAPPTRYHAFPRFTECPNLCPNAKVIPMGERDPKNAEQYSKFKDYQEMKLQVRVREHGREMAMGAYHCWLLFCRNKLTKWILEAYQKQLQLYLKMIWSIPVNPGMILL